MEVTPIKVRNSSPCQTTHKQMLEDDRYQMEQVSRSVGGGLTAMAVGRKSLKEDLARSLFRAIQECNYEAVKQLVLNTEMNVVALRDDVKCTPLHIACSKNSSSIALLLIESGADVNATNALNSTPLHYAAANGATECVTLLLSHPLTQKSPIDEYGYAPIHLAVKKSYKETLKEMIRFNIDINTRRHGCGSTCLHFAAEHGNSDMLVTLLEYDAAFLRDDQKRTPLMKAAESYCEVSDASEISIQSRLKKYARTWVTLLEKEGIHNRDNLQRNVLHRAAWKGNDIFLKVVALAIPSSCYSPMLLEKDSVNHSTPLHLAVEQGHVGCIETLILMEASAINVQDKYRNTPLHVACSRLANIRTLSENGTQTAKGYSPQKHKELKGTTNEANELFIRVAKTLIHSGSDLSTVYNNGRMTCRKILETAKLYQIVTDQSPVNTVDM